MTFAQIERIIKADGWRKIKGGATSHRHYKHPSKPGKVTIAYHGRNAIIPIGTINSILRQAGLK
jgi:predicted RNA binding protein YcfA (HicA-like mRNA interferase family)